MKSPLNDKLAYEQAVKADAAFRIDSAIVEKKFALEYMRLQLEELPVPPDDASDEDKQAYAREKVKVDALEVEIERQEEYREFIRQKFNV
ncbi:hypothetical protein [Amorphus orientalis]|uniref:Uncharacterized protein n=1 Tax=Amorphus orientalis TaxID=649198 RepID=A0AAE3VQP4_9HYPH|nr:hypothetical protein [Amorphus orientalis]MDQ0316403.1 hypothetical protein [Amorphus orientalis]